MTVDKPEIAEVGENIFRISIPLTGNPLKMLDSYYIRGDYNDLVIDTGFRREDCMSAMREALGKLGSTMERRDVAVTHLHSDHMGFPDLIKGPGRKLYIHNKELDYLMFRRTGNVDEMRFKRAGEEGHNPQLIPVPGHTPGNVMFWDEKSGIMFTGDHVLFDITPNITFWCGVENSLGQYIDSLKMSYKYPVKMALPGHRESGNYHERIEHLLKHHEARLAEALNVIKEYPGNNAFFIAGKMTWRIRSNSWKDFPVAQKWFAVGECISHLDYMLADGKIRSEMVDGCRRYYAVN